MHAHKDFHTGQNLVPPALPASSCSLPSPATPMLQDSYIRTCFTITSFLGLIGSSK